MQLAQIFYDAHVLHFATLVLSPAVHGSILVHEPSDEEFDHLGRDEERDGD